MSAEGDHRQPDVVDLIDELEELAEDVGSPELQTRVAETIETARGLSQPGMFGRVVRGFDRADLAEAFVGSLVFGIPMIIEGGTLEVGAFIATRPVYYVGTLLLGVAFCTSFVLMTAWGRVDWSAPTVAFAQICVVFVGMAIGAALGDILPGS